jgi:DNA-binding response OmpR family regulator
VTPVSAILRRQVILRHGPGPATSSPAAISETAKERVLSFSSSPRQAAARRAAYGGTVGARRHATRALAEEPGEHVDLLVAVWNDASKPPTRTVDVHVASLRRKLERQPRRPRHFLTMHRLGYKFKP